MPLRQPHRLWLLPALLGSAAATAAAEDWDLSLARPIVNLPGRTWNLSVGKGAGGTFKMGILGDAAAVAGGSRIVALGRDPVPIPKGTSVSLVPTRPTGVTTSQRCSLQLREVLDQPAEATVVDFDLVLDIQAAGVRSRLQNNGVVSPRGEYRKVRFFPEGASLYLYEADGKPAPGPAPGTDAGPGRK
ncbi:MAG: hypothetical protein ABSH53_03920 [Holophaga sp.]|jgi:hypothetical protein